MRRSVHLPRPRLYWGGVAASGVIVGGGLAAGCVVGRRLRRGVAAGQILRRRLLGSEARYRVLETEPETVEVEVIAAPGLEPGSHWRLSAESARDSNRQPGSE